MAAGLGFSFVMSVAFSKSGFARRIARTFITLALAASVSTCAQRPEESVGIRTLLPMEAVEELNVLKASIGFESIGKKAGDGVHTVLALSSGGADGAYGAGVLVGWTKSGTRPKFDVVTGVSTGALQAVLAFLGPEYDPLLEEFYTTLESKDILRSKGLGGLFGDSLYDNKPLKKQIERVITPQLLEKIAVEHDTGRRLYVATTNLDAGDLTIWDMGKIAKGGRTNKLLHFQKVLRASSAVPAYFEPVYIKPQRGIQLRQAHVDGGVKKPVLVSDFMFRSRLKKKALYMIINGSTSKYNATHAVKPTLAEISRKTILEMMRELQDNTIYRDYVLANHERAKFRITSIPDSFPASVDMLKFDNVRMKKLFVIGHAVGVSGTKSWATEPSLITDGERHAAR